MEVSTWAYRPIWKSPAGRMVPKRSPAFWLSIVSVMPASPSCFCRIVSVVSRRLLPAVLLMTISSGLPSLAYLPSDPLA
jgi:hypothetical protein